MLDRAARLARLGTRLVSALAGLLMLALLAFGGFALWQDAALRRGRDEHGLRQPRRLR